MWLGGACNKVEMLPSRDTLLQILTAGVAAPSAENRPPMRFEIGEAQVRMVAAHADAWPAQPHRRWLDLMACGAAIENMALRSQSFGLALAAQLLPDVSGSTRGDAAPPTLAQLSWYPDVSARPDPLDAQIESRHTNRKLYSARPLPPVILRQLETAARTVPGAGVVWLDTPGLRRRALRTIRLAETERFRRRQLHRELFEHMRFDVGWRASADEGLPPAALGVEPGMRGLFAQLRHWRLMQGLAAVGGARVLGWRAGHLLAESAPRLGLIVGAPGDQAEVMQAGAALQRVWLAATEAGCAFQPLAAATVLTVQPAGNGWVDATVQRRLHTLLNGLCSASGQQPYMLFRIGYARAPTIRAGRVSVERVIGE